MEPDIRHEEYDAFSGYLAYRFTGYEKDHKILIFFNRTESEDADHTPFKGTQLKEPPTSWQKTADLLRHEAPVLQETTIKSYLQANVQQAFIGRSLRSPIKYKLVDSAERNSYYEREWGSGYEVRTWSRVGFSADGQQALFFESYHFDRLNSEGHYIVMEKKSGNWVLIREISTWSVVE